MSWLEQPLALLIVFGTVYLVFELFARRNERKLLISKISEIKAEDVSKIFTPYLRGMFSGMGTEKKYSSTLRWGMVLLGIGVGLIVGFYLNYYYEPKLWDTKNMLYSASVCVFGGLSLVIAYLIERNGDKKDE